MHGSNKAVGMPFTQRAADSSRYSFNCMMCHASAMPSDAACKVKRIEIIDPKSTGAKGYVCPGTFRSTGANEYDPLPLWVRRL